MGLSCAQENKNVLSDTIGKATGKGIRPATNQRFSDPTFSNSGKGQLNSNSSTTAGMVDCDTATADNFLQM